MLPLSRLSREEARSIEVLLFDLDDTVLTHGQLTREAFDAIWSLHESGLALVAVTGRPAGWGEVLARQWPVLAVVAENGAAFLRTRGKGVERIGNEGKGRLAPLIAEIRATFPEIELADDNHARFTDVTFDIGERCSIPRPRIEELRAFVQARGARALVSSVHLHATFEGDDKASGALRALRVLLDLDAGRARARSAFVGDSENDAACFAGFRTTVGVANIAPYLARLSVPPRFITENSMGAGFAELAAALISLRT
jgi:hydroxymethylpyrimidine pyrophosphatase-like HAD family hydrolase